jgi:hypothetical protein
MTELRRSVPSWIDLADWELTDRTFSLAMDVGMYLSMVIRAAVPALRWEQNIRAKTSVDYGQPVLKGVGRVPLNAVHIMAVLAYGVARKREGGPYVVENEDRDYSGRLRELYDIWFKTLTKR